VFEGERWSCKRLVLVVLVVANVVVAKREELVRTKLQSGRS